jgi:tetratricopeptide (TPR) repeat protein
MIIHELFDRFTHPPFTGQLDHAARLETWSKRVRTVDQLLARPGSHEAIIQLYERALALNPQDWMLARNFGMALVAFGEFEAGAQWLEKAAAVIDDDPDTLYALATAQRGAGNSDEAAATFARLRKLEPKYPGLPEGE